MNNKELAIALLESATILLETKHEYSKEINCVRKANVVLCAAMANRKDLIGIKNMIKNGNLNAEEIKRLIVSVSEKNKKAGEFMNDHKSELLALAN